ncbi:hypothetical protein B0T24DRAFT_362462 [Lasiosphaeria ovina]|uniref:Uncharacterized protein n=1 Tax=Lasiosphaeria ovina TaxID=92902 RepID=A0AAE0N4Y6_9PEZI|nr:hypothetical protein B0T24DRAFT_362462 [Lasiosphaeria ovina]
MSGLYYVFVKWVPGMGNKDWVVTQAATQGRHLLCFSSRYDADEFYREFQDTLPNRGLTRASPQFWVQRSQRENEVVHFQQDLTHGVQFCRVMSSFKLHDAYTDSAPILGQQVTGPDWLSGGCFFIRNRRQPNLYWGVHGTHVHASESYRTKFRINLVGNADSKGQVLIRKDQVTVSVVAETVTSSQGTGQRKEYLGASGGRLKVSDNPYKWTFEELVCNGIGVRWESDPAFPAGSISGAEQVQVPILWHMSDEADEWELC